MRNKGHTSRVNTLRRREARAPSARGGVRRSLPPNPRGDEHDAERLTAAGDPRSESTTLIVQKFGGAILGSAASREGAARHVARQLKRGDRLVIVVSAMGREGPYSTDALRALVPSPRTDANLAALDLLMSCGEVISSVVFAQTLTSLGVRAAAISPTELGIITDRDFGSARVLHVDTSHLMDLLALGSTPVVPGFIGQTAGGAITTLGRGGSDTTAACLAAAMKANAVELYKDVGAVHDADPKLHRRARPLPELSYDDLARVASRGDHPLVHADAIAIAQRARLRIVIRGLDGKLSTVIC